MAQDQSKRLPVVFVAAAAGLFLGGSVAAQWPDFFTVTNTGNRVKAGEDFFSKVINDPLDYANKEDQRLSGYEDLDGPGAGTVAGGTLSFTVSGPQPQLWLWYPGHRGAYADEGTGGRTPINADTYHVLTFKANCTNCPTPAAGNFTAINFFWYKGPAAPEYATQTAVMPLFPGTHVYSIDLKALACGPNPASATDAQIVSVKGALLSSSNPCTAADLWSGTVQGFRLGVAGPVTSSINMSLDWATLTTANTATANISWTFSGSAKLRLLPDVSGNPGTTPMKLQRTLCFTGPACTTAFKQFDYRSDPTTDLPVNVSTLASVDVSGLGAGTYWLEAVDATNTRIAGTTPQKVQINSVPQLRLLQPDARGDESSNYPLLYRSNSDLWDFDNDNDWEPSFSNPNDPLEYGFIDRLTNPNTTCGGGGNLAGTGCIAATLSGNWMRYDNTLATLDRGDTQFFPRLGGAPIDPTRYRHVTMRMLLDRPRDRGPGNTPGVGGDLGAVSRILWFNNKPLAAGETNKLNISEDIFIQNGPQELHVDLRRTRVDPGSKAFVPFERAGYLKYFRVDPHEYQTFTKAFYNLIMLTTNDKTSDGKFTIVWNRNGRDVFGVLDSGSFNVDPDNDVVSITRIALDPDVCGRPANVGGAADPDTGGQNGPLGAVCPNPSNGNEITIATSPPNSGTFDFDAAGFSSLPAGAYYVRVEYSDSFNNVIRYAEAPLDVNPLPAAAKVPMFRLYSKTQDYHFFTINPGARAFAVSIGFQDESTPVPFYVQNTNVSGSVGLQRMYNPNRGVHFYTAASSDLPFLRTLGALHEGVEGFIFPLGSGGNPCTAVSGSVELFRLYNNNSGLHLYTADPNAKNGILQLFAGIWVQHTSLGCVFNSP